MQYIKPEISTLCIGQAASMGSFLLAAGAKGKRFSLPNSRIMVHQPSAGFQGQATDIEIHANEVLSLKKRLNEIYSKHTGKSVDEIAKQIGVKSLKFLSIEGLYKALGYKDRNDKNPQLTDHCFTGDYPVKPTDNKNLIDKNNQLSLLSNVRS